MNSRRLLAPASPQAGAAHLKGLNRLFWLHLGETKVSNAGLAHLKDFANLKEILLNDTRINDAGLEHLNVLKNLEGLNLEFTDVTDEAVEKLHQSIPRCKITYDGGVLEAKSPS